MTWALPPSVVTGKYVKASVANQALTEDLPLSVHRLAYKSSDQSNTTTTLATVTGFSFTMGAAELWYIDVTIRFVAAAASVDMLVDPTPPANSTVAVLAYGRWTSGLYLVRAHDSSWPNQDSWQAGNGTAEAVTYRGLIYTAATGGGDLTWKFAQQTASASAITFQKGSNIQGLKIGPNPYVTA